MKNPDIKTSFEYNGGTYAVDWFDLKPDEALVDIDWYQIYAVGNYENKVPVIMYPNAKDNLPGGKFEPGEDPETALRREIEEEINMRITRWYPIGYQVVTHPNGRVTNELRVYADMEKIGEFVSDPDGHVIGHKLVEVGDLNQYINYGRVGERIIELVKHEYA